MKFTEVKQIGYHLWANQIGPQNQIIWLREEGNEFPPLQGESTNIENHVYILKKHQCYEQFVHLKESTNIKNSLNILKKAPILRTVCTS